MKKVSSTLVFLVSVFLIFTSLTGFGADYDEYDMSLGDIRLNFSQENPIFVEVEDAENTSLSTNFSTDVYDKSTSLSSEGNLSLFQGILASDSALKAIFEDGDFESVIQQGESNSSVSVQGRNGLTSLRIEYSSGKETDDKHVDAVVATSEADQGVLRVSMEGSDQDISISSAQQLSRSLDISKNDARGLVEEYGERRISYTLDRLNRHSSNNSRNEVAGGGGMLEGQGPVDINNLDATSMFDVLLNGVRVAGRLMDPAIQIKILHPNNEETELKGFSPTVTVTTFCEEDSNEDVVLLTNLPFDEERGFYYLNVHEADWLIDFEKLPVGLYKVYIDIGENHQVTLGARKTEDGKLMPAR